MTPPIASATNQKTAGAVPVPDVEGYLAVRGHTEALAAPLSPEDQTVQSMPDVSPTKWHRAHTTWFFETFVLEPNAQRYELYHPGYGFLFNSYYEAVGPRHPRPHRGVLTRPSAEEVGRYREHVDAAMVDLVAGIGPGTLRDLVELGLHHEQQHQELLLMDIKHVLSCNPLRPAYAPAGVAPHVQALRAPPAAAAGAWVEHPGGIVPIGRDDGVGGFSFDNETPAHEVLLQPFSLASFLVTCGEWLAFIDDGGYERPELWLSDGWYAVQEDGWQAPLYWEHDGAGDSWAVFTLGGLHPVDPAEPVCHISYHEADAFARWAGARLPTEGEWEAAVSGSPDSFRQLDDQVWQWTASAYLPYPGFEPAAGAVGEYNGKFMVNQHVLRGGCCATPPGHARPTYRNFYVPRSRWAFTGLRLAR